MVDLALNHLNVKFSSRPIHCDCHGDQAFKWHANSHKITITILRARQSLREWESIKKSKSKWEIEKTFDAGVIRCLNNCNFMQTHVWTGAPHIVWHKNIFGKYSEYYYHISNIGFLVIMFIRMEYYVRRMCARRVLIVCLLCVASLFVAVLIDAFSSFPILISLWELKC